MIRVVEDVGAPALVWGADWATSTATTAQYNRPVGIGLVAAGYLLGGWLGYGGNFMKNIGIASFPWAANAIKSYIQEGTVQSRVGHGVSVRAKQRVTRAPAPAFVEEFDKIELE